MKLRDHARALREQKRRELEAQYPALRAKQQAVAVQPATTSAAPLREQGKRIVIGRDRNGLAFGIPDAARFSHSLVIGSPGSGKSTHMISGSRQDIRNGAAVILLDPHAADPTSIYQRQIPWLANGANIGDRKVHVIDPGSAWSCGFNPLDCPGDVDPTVIANHNVEGLERVFGDEDSQAKPTMRRAQRAIFTALAELKLTLCEGKYFLLPDDRYNARAWALAKLKDETARAYLERLNQLAANPRMSQTFEVETIAVLNRVEEITSSAAMRRVVGQQKGIDLRAAMDNGDVVLVNCAGNTKIYEKEADALACLILRSVLFHGKRRTNRRPVFLWADEWHRFLSADVPALLEEMRKYSIGVCGGMQFIAQAGMPGERIREAIMKVPQTKLVFRSNSIEEASVLAAEVVELNTELPVAALMQPTVVGYEIRHMRTQSTGGGTTATNSHGRTTTHTNTQSAGTSVGGSRETSKSVANSEGVTHSNSTTRGTADTESQSTTRSRSTTVGESESETVTTGTSETVGESGSEMSSCGGSESTGESVATGTAEAYGYDSPPAVGPLGWPDSYTNSSGTTRTRSGGSAASWASAEQTGRSTASTQSESTSISRGRSRAETVGEAETEGTAHTVSESTTKGIAHSKSRTVNSGESEGTNWAKTQQHGSSVGVGNTAGSSIGTSESWSAGFTESLVPIMEDLPGAVHDLQKVTYHAALTINKLPTFTAIVKTSVDGKVESAIITVPFINDPPEKVPGAALERLLASTPNVLPVDQADKIIAARREWLRAQGATAIAGLRKLPPELTEPKSYRVPAPKKRTRR